LLFTSPFFAQCKRGDAYISNGVFIKDSVINEVCNLWQNYLHSKPDSLYDNPYWNSAEKKQYKYFDLLTQSEINNVYMYLPYYPPSILSINREGEYYRIRTLYSEHDSIFSDPIAITNVYAKREDGKFKLYNSLPIATSNWRRHTIGSITFIHPQYHTFNEKLAVRLSQFVDSIAFQMGSPTRQAEFYFADTFDELMRAQGFDYYLGEGNNNPAAGYCDSKNVIMYGGGVNEWFPHEFVHLYAVPKFPGADNYFHEGIATLLGGTRGYSLDWLIRHADTLLTVNKDFRIDSAFAEGEWGKYADIDYITGSSYIFGGLICKMLIEKGGWELLKKFGSYQGKESRYRILQEEFGVERKDTGTFIRKKITEYARK
jgi:hypothetical protein